MGLTGCSVLRCKPSKSHGRHVFPHPVKKPDLFKIWLEATGNQRLFELDNLYIYKHYRECSSHFDEGDFGANRKLKQNAIPTLLLPVGPSTSPQPEELESFPSTSRAETPHETMETPTSSVGGRNELFETPKNRKGKRTGGILKNMNMTRALEFTPKAKYLYSKLRYSNKKIAYLRKKELVMQKRLSQALKFSETNAFSKLTQNMDAPVKRFFECQLECLRKSRKGRRFSIDDKIMALALFKQSGSGYKLLSNIFSLPSRVTIMKLLNRIPIHPGFCDSIFDGLEREVKNMKMGDKCCFLIFDEMSLSPNLSYNKHKDAVEGFENFGDHQSENIADHVQVFMLRGINSKWKQPILYQFVKEAVKGPKIAQTVRKLIERLFEIGLIVIGTICDQGTNNVNALKILQNDTRAKYSRRGEELYDFIFEVNDKMIIPLYDVPHLLKGIRNNLLKNNVQYEMDGKTKIAKWEHIVTAWELDNFSGELRAMPKLTAVSSTINLMARSEYGQQVEVKMGKSGSETAEFLKFFDSLFDSFNGTVPFDKCGKPLKTRIDVGDNETIHTKFWKNAVKIIGSMYCIEGTKRTIPPTFKNWITTIKNFLLLRSALRNFNFKHFKPRYLNQDPLENFFGKIRQRGIRCVDPTCSAFGPFYKSLLVNNLTAKHSVGSNCENDNTKIFISLKKFIEQEIQMENEEIVAEVPLPNFFNPVKPLESAAVSYVAGYISKIKLNLPKCTICKQNILRREGEDDSFHELILAREYGGARTERLQYCNKDFIKNLTIAYNITNYILHHLPSRNQLLKTIIFTIKKNVDFNFIKCDHSKDIVDKSMKNFVILLIFNYFKGANNIMSGKELRDVRDNKISELYNQAIDIQKKRRK